METPQVKFIILSDEKLAKEIYFKIRNLKENYRNSIFVEIPDEIIQSILNKEFNDVKEKIIKIISKYNESNELNEYRDKLEEYWNPLNKIFFENLRKITGFESPYDTYEVYITKIIRGCYSQNNTVFTNVLKEIKISGAVTAEEILHIYYWNIFRKIIKDIEMPWKISQIVWEISEVIPEYVLTDNSFFKFGWGNDLHRKYPFIKDIKNKLDPVWENKKDFKDFIIRIHKNIIN